MTLISTVAPNLATPPGVSLVEVETAAEMDSAVSKVAPTADVIVMAAAVADFSPKAAAARKLKKSEGIPEIVLEPTPDILANLGRHRRPGQILVGFAAETAAGSDSDLRRYARSKLAAKGVDLIVANDVAAPGVGFSHDTNAVVLVGTDGSEVEVPLAGKDAVAEAVVDAIVGLLPTDNQEQEQQ